MASDRERSEQVQELRRALVREEHHDLYHRSPAFRFGVDQLAGLLTAMVDGLAANAEEQDAKTRLHRSLVEHMPPPSPSFLDGLVERPAARGEESPRG